LQDIGRGKAISVNTFTLIPDYESLGPLPGYYTIIAYVINSNGVINQQLSATRTFYIDNNSYSYPTPPIP